MKPFLPLLTAAFGAALCAVPARAAIDRVVEKSFAVAPGGALDVATFGGDIRVDPRAGNVVKIVAHEHIRADSNAEADQLLQKLTLTIAQTSSGVSAQAEYERQSFGFHWGSWPPVQVSFEITVPAQFAVNLNTSGGDILVGDLQGAVRAHTSGGNERFGKIGAEIEASTSGGNITLAAANGKISLSTSGGNIAVGYAGGPAVLRTSGGDIKIGGAANTVSARTSGGNVSAVFTGAFPGDCLLSTSGGRVRATVAAGAHFHLNASTNGGEVRANGLAITVEEGGHRHSHLTGEVGGGGPELRLISSGGDIEIAGGGGSADAAPAATPGAAEMAEGQLPPQANAALP
jgi:hypothetical protein